MTGHEEDFTRLNKCRTKHETKTPRRRGTMPCGLGHKNRKKRKSEKTKNRKYGRYKTLKIEEKTKKTKNLL